MRRHLYIIILLLGLLSSCANLGGGPQGGPRDTIPPKVEKESPLNGTLNFDAKRIEIHFDEYIQLGDIQKNVLISPPQQKAPEIKAIGKTLSVVFADPLIDSTTYTLDFGSAICDYNEKTPLNGYIYSFSTGDVIDSLAISGRVYNSANLDPVAGVLVGIHINPADSALTTTPFIRITRTDEDGYFTIHNMRGGSYRLFALDDISRDYLYQPGEALAYADSLITPYVERREVADTTWRDTLGIDPQTKDTLFTRQIDSISLVTKTFYLPDSLVLWYFAEEKQRHYFKGVYREEPHAFSLIFSAPQDSIPSILPLSPSQRDSMASDSAWVNWMDYTLVQSNTSHDTLTFWLTDSLAIGQDSIYLEMTYLVSDSLYQLVPQRDTILAVYRRPRMSEKAWENLQRQKRERKLELKSNASGKFEIYDTLHISSAYPLDSIKKEHIHLVHRVDSITKPVSFELQIVDSLKQRIQLVATLQPSESYHLTLDSAACYDIYGKCNDSTAFPIRLKSLDEYSSLLVKLTHFDERARIQLLNDKDQVLQELPALETGTHFDHLAPTTYYLRLYLDLNADQRWTSGDWIAHRQPEPIYYFPSKLKLRANWDFEENFDHLAIPQAQSKPKALIGKQKQ
jgi:hypothetical protein